MNNKPIIHKQYKILNWLGTGSFGTVCEGIHLKTKKKVAIKIENINASYPLMKHETTILRCLQNARINAIPEIYYYGIEHPYRCLVMTFYDDGSLHKWISKMSWTDLVDWWNQSLLLLQNIHRIGFIHRDIKPDHFMRQKQNNIVSWHLIDFGIATVYINETFSPMEEPIELRTTMIGSPNWISHHIHSGKQPSRRDDCISLWFIFLYACFKEDLPWIRSGLDWTEETLQITHPNHKRMYQMKSESLLQKQIEDIFSLKALLNIHHPLYLLSFEEEPLYQDYALGKEFIT